LSKAFTKDDGPAAPEVARRRPPLPADVPNYVTTRGLLALRDELATLEPVPPGEGHQAAAARRADLEARIGTAVLAPPPIDPDEIRFGARVQVRAHDGQVREVQIVGVDEADPADGLVAFVAPLARALLGRRADDVVTVRTPRGEEELTVLAVTYDDGSSRHSG
jgi:transcription elongation factor GreB